MRFRLRPAFHLHTHLVASIAAMPLLLPLAGCFDEQLIGDPGGDGAPTAVLTVDVSSGQAPLKVLLDAKASTAFLADNKLTFSFDVDGDGEFEEDTDDVGRFAATYTSGGRFSSAVRVVGSDGRFDIAEATVVVEQENPPRTADVDVDSDNDGGITPLDELVETDQNAAFLANVDDDNGDGQRDRDTGDAADEDMADVIVRHVTGLGDGRVLVAITPQIARERTVLWQGSKILSSDTATSSVVVGAGDGDVTLRLEAKTGRTADWDGRLTITVTVEEGGAVVSTDVVNLRAAPVLFPSNLQAPRRLYVMDVPSGEDNNVALLSAFQSLPAGVELHTTNADQYGYDRWMQDNWEVGTQVVPSKNGTTEMITAIQLERSYGGQGLDAFVPNEWLGANRGFFYPAGDESSHNYGGNLEVSPPTDADPFGRMVYGGGATTLSGSRNVDTMNDNQVSFLNAQEVQGPAVEISSEWLAVGHVDEFFQVIPDLSPDEGGHNFKIAIASPAMARDVLVDLRDAGQGDAVIFSRRRNRYTVNEVLDAEQFNALNEAAQQRIDENQAILMSSLGLVQDDFRRVPVLFDEVDSGLVAAFNPGIQNLVTVGDRVFAPDPEGPIVDGVDVWQAATLQALADTDLDVIFVDVFESYHELLGEAHCGTNLEREAPSTPWWTVEQ